MNTTTTNYLYNLIFNNTKYEGDAHFLGNKAFIRKNNKLAQIEFLKGNKIGNFKEGLRDITIKIKLKSMSANGEEIETCMSFYDETNKLFLADFNGFVTVDGSNKAYDYVDETFCFVGDISKIAEYKDFFTGSLKPNEAKPLKARDALFYFLRCMGNDISQFLDFIFEQGEYIRT